jgi:hypothetical protein
VLDEVSGIDGANRQSRNRAEIRRIWNIADPSIGTELRGRTVSGLKDRMVPEGGRRRIQRGEEGASNIVRPNGKPLELKELWGIVGGYSDL